MKYFFIALLLPALCSSSLQAQPIKERPRYFANGPAPLLLVDTFQTDFNSFLVDAGNIKSMQVIKDSAGTRPYGEKGRNGVILIHIRENTTLLRLPALLDHFNIPDSLRRLRLSINEAIVRQPALLLIDPAQVQSIKPHVMLRWPDARTNEEETYLNIRIKEKNE
jgi:hypothetical protein